MKRFAKLGITILLIASFIMMGCSAGMKKIKIEKLDDLPRYTYKIDMKAVELLQNDAEMMKLIKQLKKDLNNDLEKYEIDDKTTLKGYYSSLGTIALIEKRYDDYMEYLDIRIKLEDKEAARLTKGLFTRAMIKSIESGKKGNMNAFKKEYAKLVNTLPYDIVGDDLKGIKGQCEIISENLILGGLESSVQVILDQSEGTMSQDIALGLVGSYYTINNFLPYTAAIAEVLSEYLDKNKVEKEEIWSEREVTFKGDEGYKPVVATIWDSGMDVDIFTGQLFVNKKEVPGNGVDDDRNGFVDDVNGIAYDLHSNKTPDLLYPIGDVEADRPRLQRMVKGLTDITSNIDSEEAQELKQVLSQLQQTEVKGFIEDISKYGNYSHGTHVSGIAARGNPFIRMMASRMTYGHTMIPELPTIENAQKEAKMYEEVIAYYKANNVRVVNMSWGGNLAGIEGALEANNAGGTPEERKELAREIFEIGKNALYKGIESAPEILFITSAGNANNDVTFEEFIPSSFDLPNIISIGAVDQAGDETGFTSFGKVDVYANGFEVLSYVPGGDKMKMSGTSMSSPNVTNLAAKMFAVNPNLTPSQVVDIIIKTADDHPAGERSIKLINPKNAIDVVMKNK